MGYEPSKYTLGEEIANAISHGIGAGLGIAGLAVLTVAATTHGEGRVAPCVIYGTMLVLMFTVSTLYHSFQGKRLKWVFRVLDHEMIFLMIAGTYTPLLLLGLGGAWGWSLFGVVWGLAAAGMVFQGFFTGRFKAVSTLIYVLMGWVILIALKPLLARMPGPGMQWLWMGGLCYTLGAGVYLFKKIPYHHMVWHLAVLAGAICHYFSILWYVLPLPR